MHSKLTITLIQSDIIWNNITQNLAQYDGILPHDLKTDIIVFSEVFTTGFCADIEKQHDTMTGKTIVWMRKVAARLKCAVVGSIVIKENNQFYNRLLWIEQGKKEQYYDKRHLFSLGGENEEYQQGTRKLVVEYKGWKICPLICYDLRFPVWSRNHNNYDLLLYVANWPQSRIEAWKKLLVARAIENQSYCVGVNRIGIDGNNLRYNGYSGIIDYEGNAQWMPATETIKTIEIDLQQLRAFRQSFPFWKDADNFKLL